MTGSFPDVFDPSRCVLFLGAGFSANAQNKSPDPKYRNPPVGNTLNLAMKEFSGISADDTSDFSDTAGYVLAQKLDLFGLLEGLYTIRELDPLQREILELPWWRIYTTNYDNSVSVFLAEKGRDASKSVFDLTDPPPKQLRKGAIVHLHGSIAKCNPEKIDESLVLSRRSYVEQRVKKSPWWDWFDRDMRTSQYTFFLGYDINDFEPASYLIRYPDLRERRHFILRSPKSPIAESKIFDYGVRHSFEMQGFAERLKNAQVVPTPLHESELNSFRYIDLNKDNKLPTKATSAEIQELLAFGRVRFGAIGSTLPESSYVVVRSKAIETCKEMLKKNDTLIIHGKIGNGKSIFSDELKITLSQDGGRCFVLRDGVIPLPQDIDFIKSVDNPIVFFPSYDSAITNIHLFDALPHSARYIVEVPSSTLQVRMQEALSRLRGAVARFNIDKLDKDDTVLLRELLGKAGLTKLARSTQIHSGVEFRDFLLASYDEPEVARRIKVAVDPLMKNNSARNVICASALFKTTGLPVDVGLIEDAVGEDPYAVLSGLGETVYEIMEYSVDKLEPHSSILSEHLLKKYVGSEDFTRAVFYLAAEAARRVDESVDFSSERFRLARSLLSAVLRFGFLQSILGTGAEKRKLIGRLYEDCRNSLIQKEPLFWLQYSIYWQDLPRWDLAESHIVEAYERGASRPGFKTFQLDTNYLGLLCDIETFTAVGQAVSRFDKLVELVETCRNMIHDGNHRDHVAKAFLKMEPFVRKRGRDLTRAQATSLTYSLNLVESRLNGLSAEEKSIWGTETCRLSIQRSIQLLVQTNY